MLFRSKTAIRVHLQYFVRQCYYFKALVVDFGSWPTTLRVIAIIPINNLITSINPAKHVERTCPIE